jgi:GAF domain-containing protein/anti-sigma regulatory factor (Ser/Thr protein kinase)
VSDPAASSDGMPIKGLEDVPRARQYITAALQDAPAGDLVDLAQLVTTEFVTNALLHGRLPILLRVSRPPGSARIEVSDASPVLPEPGLGGEDEMTGRGLALIDALASRWGTEQVSDGKIVWCELDDGSGAGPDLSTDDRIAPAPPGVGPLAASSALAGPNGAGADRASSAGAGPGGTEQSPPEEANRVLPLPGVPVGLLLAVEAHIEDLVRDLTLAGSSTSPFRDNGVPAAVAERVGRAAAAVAPLRRALKRQALEARAAGADEVDVTVPLGLDIVDVGAEFLAALDEADNYCRAARLLTLEAPPQHRVLRRWMADQILQVTLQQATADYEGPQNEPVVQRFQDRLLDELASLAVVQRAAARAGRLHRVATGLSEARTPEQVAGVVLEEGAAALGAARGALVRVDGGQLHLAGALGLGEPAMERASTLQLTDHVPSVDAIRLREPVWIESKRERDRNYPELERVDPASRSVVAAPLLVGERVLGVLRFGFDNDLVVDDDERDFVRALAAQAASALDRSLAYAAEHQARRKAEQLASRLGRLQEVTSALSGSLNESEVARLVLAHAVQALGSRVGTLCLLQRPGTPTTWDPDAEIRIAHMVGVTAEAQQLWKQFRLSDPLPVSDAIRTNQTVLLPTVTERQLRYPALSGGLPQDEHALVVIPLSVGDRRLGALTMSFFGEQEIDPNDLAFLSSLADACAQALDRSGAVRQLRTASERFAFLAEASVELSSSLDYARTLGRVAELAVPVLADWCSVATPENGVLRTLAVAHIDPGKVALARELQKRYPPDPETAVAYRVLRTNKAEFFSGITDEQVAATAVDDEHRRMLHDLGAMRAVMFVPMTARGRTLGVLTLLASSEDRNFGTDDLALAEDLGLRAGLAIDNAALFRDATRGPQQGAVDPR